MKVQNLADAIKILKILQNEKRRERKKCVRSYRKIQEKNINKRGKKHNKLYRKKGLKYKQINIKQMISRFNGHLTSYLSDQFVAFIVVIIVFIITVVVVVVVVIVVFVDVIVEYQGISLFSMKIFG